ncbi:hypothetical protein B5V46_18925 (plasmid) [Rhodovulum sp. MB263]|nr:hypothetical protein B5V46_18925 [Rhodovulum sp. MB263]
MRGPFSGTGQVTLRLASAASSITNSLRQQGSPGAQSQAAPPLARSKASASSCARSALACSTAWSSCSCSIRRWPGEVSAAIIGGFMVSVFSIKGGCGMSEPKAQSSASSAFIVVPAIIPVLS